MQHHRAVAWEKKLKTIFDALDDDLEVKYGHTYPLHPSRPRRGSTSNKAHDGLFNVGASFSAGYGSEHGPGYVVHVRMVTLSKVPADLREAIEREVADKLAEALDKEFPDQRLDVARDGTVYKIHGDLSLGDL